MTQKHPTRNQTPEPVRPWFARLFRRPSREVLAALAAEPTRYTEAGRMAADGFAAGIRQTGAPVEDPLALLSATLLDAQAEAARLQEHADSLEQELTLATASLGVREIEAAQAVKDRDGAYRERAQLLAWLAALHPSTAVMTASPDVDEDGWQLLYLVAGGWQMSWHIHPRDVELFRHVTVVDVTDPRAQWDGHGTEQKYERMHNHVRLLALGDLGTEVRSA